MLDNAIGNPERSAQSTLRGVEWAATTLRASSGAAPAVLDSVYEVVSTELRAAAEFLDRNTARPAAPAAGSAVAGDLEVDAGVLLDHREELAGEIVVELRKIRAGVYELQRYARADQHHGVTVVRSHGRKERLVLPEDDRDDALQGDEGVERELEDDSAGPVADDEGAVDAGVEISADAAHDASPSAGGVESLSVEGEDRAGGPIEGLPPGGGMDPLVYASSDGVQRCRVCWSIVGPARLIDPAHLARDIKFLVSEDHEWRHEGERRELLAQLLREIAGQTGVLSRLSDLTASNTHTEVRIEAPDGISAEELGAVVVTAVRSVAQYDRSPANS